jgi:phosphoglycolate phosphatase
MRFDAVIYDLDGTLLDSLQDLAETVNEVLEALGRPTYSIDAYRFMVGDGVSVLFQRALPETQTDPSLKERALALFDQIYSTRWNNRSKPYPGILPMLKKLETVGLRQCILSNKPDAFTSKCAAYFFPSAKFDMVVGHSERFPRKPDPTSARWIASQLGVCSERIAYVGDTNTDMKTAVGAGLHAIGVIWGFRPESELREWGANSIARDPEELAELLTG